MLKLGTKTPENVMGNGTRVYKGSSLIWERTSKEIITEISDTHAEITLAKIKGKSLVWNQMWNLPVTRSQVGLTITYNNDKQCYVINGTATATARIFMTNSNGFIYYTLNNSHKAIICLEKIGGTYTAASDDIAKLCLSFSADSYINLSNDSKQKQYFINGTRETQYPIIDVYNGDVFNNVQLRMMCIDLTLMYGVGNEPISLKEFEKYFPQDFYSPNQGTVINFSANKINVIGFNQWDEEWELGKYGIDQYNLGNKMIDNGCIRSKNYIPCIPNTKYYTYFGDSANIRFVFYDSDFNAVSTMNSTLTTNSEFTIPDKCYYMTLYVRLNPTTYSNNICVNLSDPSKNGTYEPYKEDVIDLSWIYELEDLTGNLFFPDGIPEKGYVTKDFAYNPIRKIDLGSLDYQVYPDGTSIFYTTIPGIAKEVDETPNCIQNTFVYDTSDIANLQNRGMRVSSIDQTVYFKWTSYTDPSAFKSAVSGMILYYECESPNILYFSEKNLSFNINDKDVISLAPIDRYSINSTRLTSDIVLNYKFNT